MTWILIFIIIIFTGLLAAVLFFTWHRQTKLTREELLSARKSAFPQAKEEEEKKEQK
jgi:Na+-translocating ferredoxin:NAD+ oxidoreductase RnfG subunit